MTFQLRKFLHHQQKFSVLSFYSTQEAIRDQKIDLKEIEQDHLGTDKEYQVPDKKKDDKAKGSTSKS